jgi:hypothetical protein
MRNADVDDPGATTRVARPGHGGLDRGRSGSAVEADLLLDASATDMTAYAVAARGLGVGVNAGPRSARAERRRY